MVTPEVAPSFRGRGREKNVEFTRVSRFVRPDLIAPTRKKCVMGCGHPINPHMFWDQRPRKNAFERRR